MTNNTRRGNWLVTMKCMVTKEVYCQDCTYQQAHDDPWDFAADERELCQDDWDVVSVVEEK